MDLGELSDTPLSRRGLLRGGLAGVLGSFGLRVAGAATLLGAGARHASGATSPFISPLRIPPVLRSSHVTLVAKEALVQLVPGLPTRMWTFNGTFPGPVIRRPSGTPTRVTVKHRLPRAGTLTIHHHGSHSASDQDGQPDRFTISPGHDRTYTYALREDGHQERGATQWYHDHSHHRVTRNAWHGLLGMFIVEDDVERALPLPKGAFDIPLVITERTLDASNQLTDPFTTYGDTQPVGQLGVGPGYAPADDLFGSRFLVNGVERPYLEVAPRKYRFRILSVAPFRPYNLTLSDGSSMVQVATESGLMPKPVTRKEVLLGPAERAELVIDFRGKQGRRITLNTSARSDGGPLPVTEPAIGELLEFRVTKRARETSRVPSSLRPLPAWVAQASSQPHRVWAFGVGLDDQARGAWTINGRTFDHTRIDAKPELGAVETWLLVNASPNLVSHYIHIHDVDWKVLSRNGSAPEPGEDALKETFRLDPGEVVVIAAKLTDHLGRFMIHCHMLQHEDHGMMTAFEVVKPGAGDGGLPGLDAALERSVPDPLHRRRVRRVIDAARDGRPAPRSVLPTVKETAASSLAQLLSSERPGFVCEP